MKYSFAGAALFAGALAVPAWAPGTETVEVTTMATITSCGPEVTNCPAKSTESWAKPTGGYGGWSDSWSESWSTSTTESAPETYSTSTSTPAAPETTSTWETSSSSTEASPVTPTTSTWAAPVTTSKAAPYVPAQSGVAPHGTSVSCHPGHPGWPGYSGTAPGGAKPTGTGTGVWSYPSASSSPITPSTGGAAQNAAGLLAGVGAVVALFL